MQKYFISKESFDKNVIDTSDAFHITTVMRSKIGDEILVGVDSKTYCCRITSLSKEKVSFDVLYEEIGNKELPVFVSIFQGYPKGDKMEEIIKHGTELGASEIIPVFAKRSVVKLEPKKIESKLTRFQTIAKEAAEQSFREIIPSVPYIKHLKEIDFSSYDYKILCYEETSRNGDLVNFKNIITSLKPGSRVAVFIGPEGGIDQSEADYLKDKGFTLCSIGPRILRCETVVFYVLSSISFEMELKKSV